MPFRSFLSGVAVTAVLTVPAAGLAGAVPPGPTPEPMPLAPVSGDARPVLAPVGDGLGAATAAALRQQVPGGPDTSDPQVVGPGDTGRLVTLWQDRINVWLSLSGSDYGPIAVDGVFGPETAAATSLFQRADPRADEDADVDPLDRVALEDAIDTLQDDPRGAPPVQAGDRGRLVAFWQDRINVWLSLTDAGFGPIAVDGIFGPDTEQATRLFQEAEPSVDVDGVVHPVDRVALEDAIDALTGRSSTSDPSTDPQQSADFPRSGEAAVLADVQRAARPSADRLSFVFEGDPGDVSYEVRYVDGATAPSGKEVEVNGDARLLVTMTPASVVDLAERGLPGYQGPTRFDTPDLPAVNEVALVSSFEGRLTWLVGTTGELPVTVTRASDPRRLVVDVQRPEAAAPQSMVWNFDHGQVGWNVLFADFPTDGELDATGAIQPLPPALDRTGRGLQLSGENTSDDLFMGIWHQIGSDDGIVAGQRFEARLEAEIASAAPTGCVGIGGPPGEAVTVKAGVVGVEPAVSGPDRRLNLDKGNQSTGGTDLQVVGDLANGVPCEEALAADPRPYRVLTYATDIRPVQADEHGRLWVMIGADSGFEGRTDLYVLAVAISLEPVPGGAGTGTG
jgi:peptidoglycan hydrolase-like protein with peptidoglycan-binding domain